MKKFLSDFLYFIRRGYSIRRAWHLARTTIE
jgi:hypothetical protein